MAATLPDLRSLGRAGAAQVAACYSKTIRAAVRPATA